MAQAVSRRPHTAEARFCCKVSPYGIFGARSGTGTDFSEYFRAVPGSIVPSFLHSTASDSDTCNLTGNVWHFSLSESKSAALISETSDRIFSAQAQLGAL